jgi:hypothetical protein
MVGLFRTPRPTNNVHTNIHIPTWSAFTIKGTNWPKVYILSKDYVFSSLKHGLHVLDRAHYRMIGPTSKV